MWNIWWYRGIKYLKEYIGKGNHDKFKWWSVDKKQRENFKKAFNSVIKVKEVDNPEGAKGVLVYTPDGLKRVVVEKQEREIMDKRYILVLILVLLVSFACDKPDVMAENEKKQKQGKEKRMQTIEAGKYSGHSNYFILKDKKTGVEYLVLDCHGTAIIIMPQNKE